MGRHSDIPTLYDFCKQISITELKRWNYLKPNHLITGMIKFTFNNYDTLEMFIKVSTEFKNSFLELKYSINNTELNYRIYFEVISSNLGNGKIYYFNCPISNTRCRKLYLINGYFQHRNAYKKGYYQTQTLGTKDKFLIRQFDKLQKSNKAKINLNSKYFKRYYKGKPTKRYLKNLKEIESSLGINEMELLTKR